MEMFVINRDRFLLIIRATMVIGTLSNGVAVAGDVPVAQEPISQEIGLAVSNYKYEEKDLMSLKAVKAGIDYSVKFSLASGWFIKGDARYAYGDADYNSNRTGSADGESDWYTEWRLTSGYDFALDSHTLSPYVGLGYRYLFNDGRGLTSTGHVGYRRESRYVYLPLGLRHTMVLSAQSRLVNTVEYDRLLQGRQRTVLSDTEGYYGWLDVGDVTNKQKRGYGVRLSSMYHMRGWSLGPYASYWKIAESEEASNESTHSALPGFVIIRYWVEPANTTREAGFKVSYTF